MRLFYLKIIAERVEELIVELFGIVTNNGMGYPETADQVLPDEVFHLRICNFC